MNGFPKKRTLQQKIIILLVLIGLFPLLVAFVSSYFSQRATLTTAMGLAFEGVAKETSLKLGLMIEELVGRTRIIAGEASFKEALLRSNSLHPSAGAAAALAEERERQWAGLDFAEKREQMDDETGRILENVVSRAGGLYEQVLLVDRQGSLVAASNVPRQHEYGEAIWRRAAMAGGRGGVFVGDVEWDGDLNRYVLPVGVPLRDSGKVIGALYAVHTIDRVFRSVTGVHLGKSDHTMLANSQGDLLFCPIFQIKNHTLSGALTGIIAKPDPGWAVSEVDVHYPGKRVINGFSPVQLNIPDLSNLSLGGQQWFIFTSQNPDETYAPLGTLLRWTGLSAVFGIGVLVVLAILVSRYIVTPITRLEGATREIISGIVQLPQPGVAASPVPPSPPEPSGTEKSNPPLGISTGDEIEDLARSFSKISGVLDQTRAQLVETTRRLEEMATTDELTQLYNRHFIWKELRGEFVRSLRFKLNLSCLMIDLDYFKEINDRFGHQVGDRVLSELASLLLDNSREPDTVGRFGGEEFIVILPQTDSKGACVQAERLRDEVASHPFPIESGQTLRVTISIGVSSFPDDRITEVEDLVRTADEALYTSKEQGRNKVTLA